MIFLQYNELFFEVGIMVMGKVVVEEKFIKGECNQFVKGFVRNDELFGFYFEINSELY